MQVPPKKKKTPTVVESKKGDVTGADDAPVSVAPPVSQPNAAAARSAEPAATTGGPAMRTRTATAGTEPTTIS